ncbi:MAG: ATP-binding protein [Pseudonocardia sp.]
MAAIRIDTDVAERVLTPRGELAPDTADVLRTTVHAHLTAWVDVRVDLGALTVARPGLLHVFPLALADAGGWPTARLVLFGAREPTALMLRTQRIDEAVPVGPHRSGARPLLGRRPQRLCRRIGLAPDADVRALVDAACAAWSVAGRFPDAPLVVAELAANAAAHGGAPALLILSLDRRGLHVAVRDADPRGAADVRRRSGRGLDLVAELARAWGVAAHADGKTVWAVLAGPRRVRRRHALLVTSTRTALRTRTCRSPADTR